MESSHGPSIIIEGQGEDEPATMLVDHEILEVIEESRNNIGGNTDEYYASVAAIQDSMRKKISASIDNTLSTPQDPSPIDNLTRL